MTSSFNFSLEVTSYRGTTNVSEPSRFSENLEPTVCRQFFNSGWGFPRNQYLHM